MTSSVSHSSRTSVGGSSVKLPPGAILILNFITPAEEKILMDYFDRDDGKHWSDKLKRLTQQFGFTYDYSKPKSKPIQTQAIPDLIQTLVIDRLKEKGGVSTPPFDPPAASERKEGEVLDSTGGSKGGPPPLGGSKGGALAPPFFDQCIVNDYKPGQGINGHVDNVDFFRDTIASLSLNSEYTMNLIPVGTTAASGASDSLFELERKRVAVRLPRRSMLILSGESRYNFEHEIPGRKTDRVDGKIVPRGRRVSVTVRSTMDAV